MAPLSRENTGVDAMKPADGPQPIEIVFSFDTTGSMSSCIGEVRKKVQEIMERLSKDIPALRMAVFAHGDYCDARTYVTKWLDFTTDVKDLCDFVKNVSGTSGGDFPECYELVLRQVREELTWTSGTQRSLVMIGDAIPHEAKDPQNKLNIDWKEEVDRLYNEMGVRIYSVQCGANPQTEEFCKTMADKTSGKHLRLQNFETIVDIMMSIVFRERGVEYFDEFEKEVRAREGAGIRWELDRMLNTLADRGDLPSTSAKTPPIASVTPLRRSSTSKPPSTPMTAKPAAGLKGGKATPKAKPLKRIRDARVKKPMTTMKKASTSKALKRVLRESVTDRHLLQGLDWNGWSEAMLPTEPNRSRHTWKQRQNNHTGYRCTGLYKDNNTPAMFELAVATPDSPQKVPVWCGFTNGFEGKNWDSYFLRSETLREQVDNVLERGCKLYLRRATGIRNGTITHSGQTCSNMKELKNVINQTYDYAWSQKSKPRQLFPRRSRRSSVLARRSQPY